MKRILIADHEHNVTFTLKKVLQAESYEVQSCNDTDLLMQLSGAQNFDLVIVNSRMTMSDGSDPIPSLQITQPSAAFIIIYDQGVSAPRIIPRVFDQIRKPIDFQHTINRIKELFNGGGFSGIISGINLADYIQMLCMDKITKAILVRKNKQQGIILVQEGKIIYADTTELKGEMAFHEVLSWKEGQIKEVKVKKFPRPNIDKDIQQLLLGATLSMDEKEETAMEDGMAEELFGTEIVASLHEESDQKAEIEELKKQEMAQFKNIPRESFMRRYLGKGTLVLTILLVGLVFTVQAFFKDKVEASKTPLSATIEAKAQNYRKSMQKPLPKNKAEPTASPASGKPATVLTKDSLGRLENPNTEYAHVPAIDHSQQNHRINVSQSVPQESGFGKEEVILKLHGSNTIGAKLAPTLIVAYLQNKLHATEIKTIAGAKENEQTITAKLNGKPIAVEIQAHGSSTAFQDLKAGICDIGDASRKIKEKEETELSFLGDMTGISSEHVIGLDGIAVLVNKSNDLKQIGTDALQTMFSGKITDWKGVNGQGGPIDVYARDDKSGTYDTFKSIILGKKHSLLSTAKRYESNALLSDDVSEDPAGIGFTGLPYVRNAKALAVSEEGAQPIYPNFFTVATEDYPISRRLYMYTATIPKNPHVTPFINFVLSQDGQKVVQKVGFVDMNIRSFFMDASEEAGTVSNSKVRDYVKAVKGARRLSLNFRFKKGKTELDNRSLRDMDRIISFLADKLDKRIILAGFSDNSGDYDFNYRLAMARARFVASELRARGIAVNEVFSCGQEMPVASNITLQGREKNRRVEVWLK